MATPYCRRVISTPPARQRPPDLGVEGSGLLLPGLANSIVDAAGGLSTWAIRGAHSGRLVAASEGAGRCVGRRACFSTLVRKRAIQLAPVRRPRSRRAGGPLAGTAINRWLKAVGAAHALDSGVALPVLRWRSSSDCTTWSRSGWHAMWHLARSTQPLETALLREPDNRASRPKSRRRPRPATPDVQRNSAPSGRSVTRRWRCSAIRPCRGWSATLLAGPAPGMASRSGRPPVWIYGRYRPDPGSRFRSDATSTSRASAALDGTFRWRPRDVARGPPSREQVGSSPDRQSAERPGPELRAAKSVEAYGRAFPALRPPGDGPAGAQERREGRCRRAFKARST